MDYSWNSAGKIGRIGRHLAETPDVEVTMCLGPMPPDASDFPRWNSSLYDLQLDERPATPGSLQPSGRLQQCEQPANKRETFSEVCQIPSAIMESSARALCMAQSRDHHRSHVTSLSSSLAFSTNQISAGGVVSSDTSPSAPL